MRRELIWAIAAVAALTVGVTCAEGYARLATPYYAVVSDLITRMRPWKVVSIEVAHDDRSSGAVLRLVSEVRRHRDDPRAAVMVVSRVAVGEVVETPIVFWTVLLIWPAHTIRQRMLRLALAIPGFLALEAVTTACQLVCPLAQASAILAGDSDPLTLWERWSRFLEAGGRFVLEVAAALWIVALTSQDPGGDGRAPNIMDGRPQNRVPQDRCVTP